MEYDPNVSQPTDFPLTKVPEMPTLRDFFAGCALIAEMLDTAIERTTCPPETEARAAYLVADAMLKAREVE